MNTSGFICIFILLGIAGLSQSVTAASTRSGPDPAIAGQSRALMDALARGDAHAAANLFTADARLIVSNVGDPISGRQAIENFWLAVFGSGLESLELSTREIEGEGAMRFETGVYRARGAGGAELGFGHYLFVWKKEGGEWRIHRDIASAVTKAVAPASAPAASGAAAGAGTRLPADYRALARIEVKVALAEPSIHTVYANDPAAAMLGAGKTAFPEGALLIMEFANAVRDGKGEVMREKDGTPVRGEVIHVDVMRRGPGFGLAYGESRAGEWEFASFRPDGGVLVAPENGAKCAACHQKAGAARDFVFRAAGSSP